MCMHFVCDYVCTNVRTYVFTYCIFETVIQLPIPMQVIPFQILRQHPNHTVVKDRHTCTQVNVFNFPIPIHIYTCNMYMYALSLLCQLCMYIHDMYSPQTPCLQAGICNPVQLANTRIMNEPAQTNLNCGESSGKTIPCASPHKLCNTTYSIQASKGMVDSTIWMKELLKITTSGLSSVTAMFWGRCKGCWGDPLWSCCPWANVRRGKSGCIPKCCRACHRTVFSLGLLYSWSKQMSISL